MAKTQFLCSHLIEGSCNVFEKCLVLLLISKLGDSINKDISKTLEIYFIECRFSSKVHVD